MITRMKIYEEIDWVAFFIVVMIKDLFHSLSDFDCEATEDKIKPEEININEKEIKLCFKVYLRFFTCSWFTLRKQNST